MITQYFSGSHKGIDIAGPAGSPVVASASGQVVLVSYGNTGYGNYIVIRHSDRFQTLYSHLSAIYVGMGQWVEAGQTIGAVGCTGWCTGPHLHFEIREWGTPVDPLIYLP
jgi:murein DD-endopeptidase MepM/ murein hydrolase activator NlpD